MADPRIIEFEGRRISVPADATDDEVAQIIGKPQRSSWSRGAGLVAQGVADSVADTLGAPVDLSALALRTMIRGVDKGIRKTLTGQPPPEVGPVMSAPVGGSQTWRDAFDYVGTLPGRVADSVNHGSFDPMTEARAGGRMAPQDVGEKWLYGAGRGAGGAASMFVPASAIAGALAPNTAAQGVARTMAAAPGWQTAAGVAGGGVSEATGNPYLGMAAAAATPVGGSVVRRATTPAVQLSDENRRLAEALRNHGVPMSAAQASGSRAWRGAESVLGNHPVTAAIAARDSQMQRAAFNRAVSGLTGDGADSITPQYLANTKARIGSGFDEIAGRSSVNLDDQFHRDVSKVTGGYGDTLDALKKPVFDKLVAQMTGADKPMLDRLIGAINGTQKLDGQTYQQLRSQIGAIADSAMSSDPYYGRALAGLQKSLDDAMARSVSPKDAADWRQLRGEYSAYKTLDDTMRASNAGGGDVPPTQLWMQARDRNNSQMKDLARAGQEFVRDTIPNSGTPQRQLMQTLLTGGAVGGLALEPITASAVLGGPLLAQALMRGAPKRMASQFPTEDLALNALAQRLIQDSQGGRLVPR